MDFAEIKEIGNDERKIWIIILSVVFRLSGLPKIYRRIILTHRNQSFQSLIPRKSHTESKPVGKNVPDNQV